MFFPRFIKWLSKLPPPYSLGLLWWGEATIYLTGIAGAYLLSGSIYDNIKPQYEQWLFLLELLIYFLVFYLMHFVFSKVSELMEALLNIHRQGGLIRIQRIMSEVSSDPDGSDEVDYKIEPDFDPLKPPKRIRASAGPFKTRYFIVLPSAFLLYLLGFVSTIYKIFVLQVQTWEQDALILPALGSVIVACVCYLFLMPHLPGYVSVRNLIKGTDDQGE